MKLSRKITALILTLICSLSCISFSTGAATGTTTKKVTVHRYSMKNYTIRKTKTQQKYTYKYSVKNNSKNYVKVRVEDWGVSCYVEFKAKKITGKKVPEISVYYKDGDTKVTVKKYKVTVDEKEKVDFSDVKINKGTTKTINLINPYYKDYYFKLSNSETAKIDMAYYAEGEDYQYKVKGLKKGTTKVDVYLQGFNAKVGSFNITVGTFPTFVKPEYKGTKLKYSGHGSNAYMSESHVYLKEILEDKKDKTKYSVESSNEKVVSSLSSGEIYATGKGKATCTVYEKTGKSKKKAIDKFTVTVKKAPMSYVVKENAMWYDEGVFGQGEGIEILGINTCKTLNMKRTIVDCLINNKYLGSHFKKSLYNITYKSSNKSVATVSKDGVVTSKGYGNATVTYTIKFTDKSKYVSKCQISVEHDDFFEM